MIKKRSCTQRFAQSQKERNITQQVINFLIKPIFNIKYLHTIHPKRKQGKENELAFWLLQCELVVLSELIFENPVVGSLGGSVVRYICEKKTYGQNGLSALAGISKNVRDRIFIITKNETAIAMHLTHCSQIACSFNYPY